MKPFTSLCGAVFMGFTVSIPMGVKGGCGYGEYMYGGIQALDACQSSYYGEYGYGESTIYRCSDDGNNITYESYSGLDCEESSLSYSYDATYDFTSWNCDYGDSNDCLIKQTSYSGYVWDGFNVTEYLEYYSQYRYWSVDCDYRYIYIDEDNSTEYNISVDSECYNYSHWNYSYVETVTGNWTVGYDYDYEDVYVYVGPSDTECDQNYSWYFDQQYLGYALKWGYYVEEYNCTNKTYDSDSGDCANTIDEILATGLVNYTDYNIYEYYYVVGVCNSWNVYACGSDGSVIYHNFNDQNCTGNASYSYNESDYCSYSSEMLSFSFWDECTYDGVTSAPTMMPTPMDSNSGSGSGSGTNGNGTDMGTGMTDTNMTGTDGGSNNNNGTNNSGGDGSDPATTQDVEINQSGVNKMYDSGNNVLGLIAFVVVLASRLF